MSGRRTESDLFEIHVGGGGGWEGVADISHRRNKGPFYTRTQRTDLLPSLSLFYTLMRTRADTPLAAQCMFAFVQRPVVLLALSH